MRDIRNCKRAVQELIRNRLTAVQRLDVTASLLDEQNVLKSVMREDIDRISATLASVDAGVFDDVVRRTLRAEPHLYYWPAIFVGIGGVFIFLL